MPAAVIRNGDQGVDSCPHYFVPRSTVVSEIQRRTPAPGYMFALETVSVIDDIQTGKIRRDLDSKQVVTHNISYHFKRQITEI